MKQKYKIFILSLLLLLSGCTNSSDTTTSNDALSSDSHNSSTESSASTSENSVPPSSDHDNSSSSENAPLPNGDVAGLTRSTLWPSTALAAYLTYDEFEEVPQLVSESDFFHGEYANYLELTFYRIFTRVRTSDDFTAYKTAFLNYGYTAELEQDENNRDMYRIESQYDEINLFLQAIKKGDHYEVTFDFFDGYGDNYQGLRAEDNVAFFNLRTKTAVANKSAARVRWEIRPATFTVNKGESHLPVGNTNNEHISNPLRVYAGNTMTFAVSSAYYISEIYVLAASGYLDEFIEQGSFSDTQITVETIGPDNVKLYPSNELSHLNYSKPLGFGESQTRLLEIKITFALRQH